MFSIIYPIFTLKPGNCGKLSPPELSNKETSSTAPDRPKPTRRGSKKPTSTDNKPSSSTKIAKRPRKTAELTKSNVEKEAAVITEDNVIDDELYDYNKDPPLIYCFGTAQWEFVPTVRMAPEQMHRDITLQWEMLQWNLPEFARAPGGPPSTAAISHVRLGGRAAFIGKVGNDELGEELLLMMNKEKVLTHGYGLPTCYLSKHPTINV